VDPEHPALLGLVRAVCDGASVDWDATDAPGSDSFRQTLEELRLVAEIANLNRSLGGEIDTAPTTPPRARGGPAVPPPFARWGHLHLLDHVASGAFGDVYRAWDPAIDREVALKLLRPTGREGGESDQRVEEGRLLARVRHPNVVTVFGAARIEGRAGVWMEFVAGRTLAQVVEGDGPLPPDRVAALGATLCDAVAAVHDAGLLHRDVKAQNVVLGEAGRLVLMDLGAGRERDVAGRDVAGTPLYLAPEVFAGQAATVQSDLYSLGVLLHLLAMGTFPRDAAPAPAGALTAVIARSLARDPADRFGSAAEMADALRTAVAPVSLRGSRVFLVTATALLAVVAVASLLLARTGVVGADAAGATPRAALSGAAAAAEATRKLPWRLLPTGPPSPDGRWIGAVEWDADTGAGVPVAMELATEQARRLWEPTRTEADSAAYAISSSFSPDSAAVAVSWRIGGSAAANEVRVCAPDGTERRTVYRETGATDAELRVVGWSADGDEILVLRGQRRAPVLFWVAVSDGRRRDVRSLPVHPSGSLHPNGRDLVIDWPQPGSPDRRDLAIVDAVTGEVRPLLAEPAHDAMPLWLPDGRHVLFASDRGGAFGAWVIDASAAAPEPQQVRGSMGYWEPVGFGARGELYYIAQTGTVDVYTAPVDLALGRVGARRRAAASFSGRNLFSDWAPDNRRLAFTSRRGPVNFAPNSQYLVVRDMATQDERVLPIPFGEVGPIRWAPDGRRIAIPASGPPRGIWMLSVGSGRLELAAPVGAERFWSLDWLSRDRLVFVGTTPQGPSLFALWLRTHETKVLATGVSAVSVAPGRDRLAVLAPAGGGVAVAVSAVDAPSTRREILRWPHPARLELAGWTPDGAFVVVVHRVDGTSQAVRVLAIPAAGGPPHTLGEAQLGGDARTVRLSPDGSRLSFEAGAPVLTTWVLEHPLLAR
jgi:dipeptidyl aminopeptidase/acylaminoacyl peptidase